LRNGEWNKWPLYKKDGPDQSIFRFKQPALEPPADDLVIRNIFTCISAFNLENGGPDQIIGRKKVAVFSHHRLSKEMPSSKMSTGLHFPMHSRNKREAEPFHNPSTVQENLK
jgi:hypothetical protein